MAGRRSSRVFPGLRSCSGEKHVGSSKVDKGAEKVVVINLDDDDEVMIDDIKSSKPQPRGSSTLRHKKVEVSTVIDIDDDDDDSTETDTVISVENIGDLDSDATSSKSRIPTSNYRQNSVSSDRDECEVVQEKCNPSKGPKGKQTYSGKAPSGNRFGLYSESEFESGDSDIDQFDCELMEGSSGELHEHWKKASEKKKHVIHQASGSGSHGQSHVDLDAETNTDQHADAPVCSSSDHGIYDREFPDLGTCGDHSEGSSSKTKMKSSSAKSNQNNPKENSPCAVPGSAKEAESLHRNDDFQHDEHVKNPLKAEGFHKDGIFGFSNKEQSPENHSVRSMDELGGKQYKHFMPNKQKFRDGTCFTGSPKSSLKFNDDQRSAGVSDDEFACKNQHSSDMHSTHDSVEAGAKDVESHYSQSNRSASLPNDHQQGVSFEEKVKPVPEQSFDGLHVDPGITPSDDDLRAVLKESTVYDDKSEISNEYVSEEKVGADLPDLSCNNTGSNQQGFVSTRGNESFDVRNQLLAQEGSATPVKNYTVDVQNNIITDREKLKETAEYKLAMEEEMESRRRVLQIQAEESQRLRKRKKAESLRLLDMQRRQKQRVEEVRETQKKDEENLNMKDNFRAEIRKELNRLELSCKSITSLLRGLGIQVGASIRPSPQEVQAAYKQALLKFHPDRASRTDIRQLVEAEEKFKLISRMKEKLISTTWF